MATELLGINSFFYIGMTKETFLSKLSFQPLKQQAYLQLLVKITGFTFVNMVTKTLLYDLSLATAVMNEKIIAENQNHKTLLVSYLLL